MHGVWQINFIERQIFLSLQTHTVCQAFGIITFYLKVFEIYYLIKNK